MAKVISLHIICHLKCLGRNLALITLNPVVKFNIKSQTIKHCNTSDMMMINYIAPPIEYSCQNMFRTSLLNLACNLQKIKEIEAQANWHHNLKNLKARAFLRDIWSYLFKKYQWKRVWRDFRNITKCQTRSLTAPWFEQTRCKWQLGNKW